MGSEYIIKCENCKAKKEIMLGVGMEYFCLEHVIDCVHYTKKKNLLDFCDKHNISLNKLSLDEPDTCFSHELYICPECKEPYNHFYVKITASDGAIFETTFQCSRCKTDLVQIDFDAVKWKNIPCWKCGSKKLKISEEIMWD